jgi:rare lipoprotein A
VAIRVQHSVSFIDGAARGGLRRLAGAWALALRRRGTATPAVLAVIAAGSLLASCALPPTNSRKSGSKEYFSEKEYGVEASPRLVAFGELVPKGGGSYLVGKPYKVRGKTYRPRENPDYTAVGLASWYGGAFHGRKTANGEIYDMSDLTAAHPTLPLPSYARVTNLANDRSVIVRINDRGPFKKGRIIDVSSTVAEMLDFKRAGTAKVKVEYVGKARMDGLDKQMLVSSYRGPNDFGHDTLYASKVTRTPEKVVVASLTPRKQPKGRTELVDRSIDLFGEDPLGPLILRTGFETSYAPTNHFSGAQFAAAEVAEEGDRAMLVQIGTFGDRANAERIGERFAAFGRVVTQESLAADRTLYSVRVVIDKARVRPETVITAAHAAGLGDAFVVSQ